MKKRVHELAKELKVHGIELDNKELVTELQSLGYDVKSHSSSLEDDQASTAVERLVAKLKPKTAPAPVKAAGFVVRKRPADAPAPVAHPPAAPVVHVVAAPVVAVRAPEPAPVPEPVHVAPVAAVVAPVAPVVVPVAPVVVAPVAPPTAPVVAPPAVVAPVTAPVAAQPTAAPATARPGEVRPNMPPASDVARPAAPVVPAPAANPPPGPVSQTAINPATGRPISGPTGPASRPPVRPPMGAGGQATPHAQASASPNPQGNSASGPQIRTGPNNTVQVLTGDAKRPTATQAVVISRPLIPIKRVTPVSRPISDIPVAPGRKGIPGPTVVEVRRGPGGGPVEIIDTTKDKQPAGGAKKKRGSEKGNLSKQELADLARGRTSLPLRGKKKRPTKKGNKTQITQMAADKKVVEIEESITVTELGQQMGVRTAELIGKLMKLGQMVTANQLIPLETAEMLAVDYGWKVEKVGFEVEDYISDVEDKEEDLYPRPPVVTVMGHVDHGKTSLLDAIREADVAAGEAGGITQHIGAYSVLTSKGPITFLDTPGHEAFSAMRQRGANITDVVVLVVAADDGVMPQTIEAIKHAKQAQVPIIVAINKIDKPGADPSRVKTALMEHGLVPEEFGGDTIMVPVSAKQKMGLENLLEMIALQAEVLELKSNPSRAATGAVIEAKLDKGRGPVATVLVQEGTLKLGDALVSGMVYGKVRAMMNERGDQVEEVPPGFPVEVLGLSGVPVAGDEWNVVEDEKSAKEVADHRIDQERKKSLTINSRGTLEGLYSKIEKGEAKELKVVIKADTQGSVEAVAQALTNLSTKKVKVNVIHKAVGGINESDVMRASSSNTIIVGFNVKPEATAAGIASQQEVPIKLYTIIYAAVDEVKLEMENLLEPIRREKPIGKAEVRQLFVVPKLGTIAGVAVLDGKITRSAQLRLMRANKMVFQGKIKSLRRLKDDVREVAAPLECGIGIENFNDILVGDTIEAFEIEEIRQSLS